MQPFASPSNDVPACPSLCSKTTFSESQDGQSSISPCRETIRRPGEPKSSTHESPKAPCTAAPSNRGTAQIPKAISPNSALSVVPVLHPTHIQNILDPRRLEARPEALLKGLSSSPGLQSWSPYPTGSIPNNPCCELDDHGSNNSQDSRGEGPAQDVQEFESDWETVTEGSTSSRCSTPSHALVGGMTSSPPIGSLQSGIVRSLAWILNPFPITAGSLRAVTLNDCMGQGAGRSQFGTATDTAGSSSSGGSSQTGAGNKRSIGSSDGDQGHDENNDQARKHFKGGQTGAALAGPTSSKRFACPFQKLKGQAIPHCSMPSYQNRSGGYETFSRVK